MYEVGSFACHDADNLKIENENYVNEKLPYICRYIVRIMQKDGQIGIHTHRYNTYFVYDIYTKHYHYYIKIKILTYLKPKNHFNKYEILLYIYL